MNPPSHPKADQGLPTDVPHFPCHVLLGLCDCRGQRRRRVGGPGCQLIQHLRDRLVNAKALKEFHHRHVHLQVNRDPVLQLDGHQGVQSEMAQGLLDVQPGWAEPEHPGHLLAQVGLQQLPAFRWFGRKKGIPPFARATRWPGDFGFLTRQFREQRRDTARRIKLAILLPVDWHRHDLGCALPEQSSQHFQRLPGRDAADSQEREARGETLAANRIRESLTGPGTPVDAQGRLTLGLPVMRQRIQESVGGGIVPLTGLAQHRTRGREKYEEVQGIVLKQAMQQPATHHLGPQNRIQCRRIELHQQSVLQHARRVHDTPDRRPTLRAKLVQKAAQLSFIRHIDRRQMHACSQGFQFPNGGDLTGQATSGFDRSPVRARRELGASQKDQPPRPLLDHPTRDQEAEVSESSADQIAAVRPPLERMGWRGRWALADQTGHVSPPLTKRKLILSIRSWRFPPTTDERQRHAAMPRVPGPPARPRTSGVPEQ